MTEATAYPTLYHGTSTKHIKSILSVGLAAPNNWGSLAVAKYFAHMRCLDDGGKPVIIGKPIGSFNSAGFKVDENAIDFCVLPEIDPSTDEDALMTAWDASGKGWEDSLRLYQAVVYNAPVVVEGADVIR